MKRFLYFFHIYCVALLFFYYFLFGNTFYFNYKQCNKVQLIAEVELLSSLLIFRWCQAIYCVSKRIAVWYRDACTASLRPASKSPALPNVRANGRARETETHLRAATRSCDLRRPCTADDRPGSRDVAHIFTRDVHPLRGTHLLRVVTVAIVCPVFS